MGRSGGQRLNLYVGIGVAFALVLGAYVIYQLRVVVLALLVTVLLSVILSGPVDFLARRGLGRGWATLAVMGGLVLAVAGLAVAPTAEAQIRQLVETFRSLLVDAQKYAARLQGALGLDTGFRLRPDRLLEAARGFLSGGTLATFADVRGRGQRPLVGPGGPHSRHLHRRQALIVHWGLAARGEDDVVPLYGLAAQLVFGVEVRELPQADAEAVFSQIGEHLLGVREAGG